MRNVGKVCSSEDCSQPATRRGLCSKHYQRMRVAGIGPFNKKCSVDGCDRPVDCKDLCGLHYQRLRNHGDVTYSESCPRYLTMDEKLKWYGWDVTPKGCWELHGTRDKDGYVVFYAEGKNQHSHRVAYKEWVGPIPDGLVVRHKCDNPPCINPEHLELGTVQDNVNDRVTRGRSNVRRGSESYNAVLTEDDVANIRSRYAQGNVYQRELADEYHVSTSAIGAIVRRKRWKHVE